MNFAILALLVAHLFLTNTECIVVTVEQGQLRGEILQVVTGDDKYVSFKGIPYAKPPLGDLRFMSPQPPDPWNGIRNATEHGSVCLQLNIYNQRDISGREDCLFLNVYTPSLKPKNLIPVMLFIHGNGFQSGSGNADRYGPDYLVSQNIVLVTINYRLGPLGFLTTNSKEVPGNAGLKDQVAALKWVKKNIATFGGNPNEVTIFGQSAGGTSIGLHNLSPMTIGLFKRSVLMSGVPFNDWAWPFEPRRLAFRLGQQLGLWTLDDHELVTFLKSLPAEKLLGTKPAVLRSEVPNVILKHLIFTPTVETDVGADHFLTVDPVLALKEGKVHDVDLMIGYAAEEGLLDFVLIGDTIYSLYTNFSEMVVPRKIQENISPANMFKLADAIHTKYFGDKPIDHNVAQEFVNYISDSSYNYGIIKYAKGFSKFSRTFMYRFSILTDFPRYTDLSNKYGINGATHEDDLLYLFYPHSGNITITKDSADYKLVQTVCTLFANFAKYGNPTPTYNSVGVTWPEYNCVTGTYLDINNTLSVGHHLDSQAVTFWDSIYKDAGLSL